jgi:hypothetical protein
VTAHHDRAPLAHPSLCLRRPLRAWCPPPPCISVLPSPSSPGLAGWAYPLSCPLPYSLLSHLPVPPSTTALGLWALVSHVSPWPVSPLPVVCDYLSTFDNWSCLRLRSKICSVAHSNRYCVMAPCRSSWPNRPATADCLVHTRFFFYIYES